MKQSAEVHRGRDTRWTPHACENVKIAERDGCKQELLAQIAELTVEAISPEQVM